MKHHLTKMFLFIILTMTLHIHALMVTTPVSVGELIDKITILQIKSERITDKEKLSHIQDELSLLEETRDQSIPNSEELTTLTGSLKQINQQLWDIEDAIRDKELNKEFDQEFIKLARAVYVTNDKRCAVKRTINEHCGSNLVEEKSYKKYS